MMNIIRADIYRITRNKGIIANFIGIAVSSALLIIIFGFFGEGREYANAVDAAMGLFELSNMAIIFVLPIFTIVAAPIFRDGTVKNEVSWGISRATLYITRLLIITVLVILLRIVLFASGMLTATIFFGFGDAPAGFWLEFFQIFGSQLFLFIAASWLGVFIVFTIQNAYAVIEVWAGLLLMPMLIANSLEQFNIAPNAVEFIRRIDLAEGISRLANMSELDTGALLRIFAIGAFWLILPTVFGLIGFQAKEIK